MLTNPTAIQHAKASKAGKTTLNHPQRISQSQLRGHSMLFLLIVLVMACTTDEPRIPQYRFDNGLWFNGEVFKERIAFIEDGRLKFSNRAGKANTIIDLDGGFVIAPYCEGHNHNIGGSADDVEAVVQRYLQDGVFYAMMPGSFSLYRSLISDKINNQNSVDVSFSNNGLTGSGGHPRGLREMLMERFGRYPEFTKETLPDKGYFEADTLPELEEKWELIRVEKPDFVKVMLYFSDEYEQRKNNPDYYGRRGLNPELLPELVRMAHKAALRVAVHVENEADMKAALQAGADIIAHLPSYDSATRLSDETIALAVETKASIITTFTIAKRFQIRSPDRYANAIAAQRDNLKRLHDAGATLIIGSDNVHGTSKAEAEHIASLGVLDNLAVLKMWTENCAQAVFPNRKIGRLADNYEASFLVLNENPLTDFTNTNSIRLRVKEGTPLDAM